MTSYAATGMPALRMKACNRCGWNFRSMRASIMWSHNSSASHAARLLNRPYFVQLHTDSSGFRSGMYRGKSSATTSGCLAKYARTNRDSLWMPCRSHTTVSGPLADAGVARRGHDHFMGLAFLLTITSASRLRTWQVSQSLQASPAALTLAGADFSSKLLPSASAATASSCRFAACKLMAIVNCAGTVVDHLLLGVTTF